MWNQYFKAVSSQSASGTVASCNGMCQPGIAECVDRVASRTKRTLKTKKPPTRVGGLIDWVLWVPADCLRTAHGSRPPDTPVRVFGNGNDNGLGRVDCPLLPVPRSLLPTPYCTPYCLPPCPGTGTGAGTGLRSRSDHSPPLDGTTKTPTRAGGGIFVLRSSIGPVGWRL